MCKGTPSCNREDHYWITLAAAISTLAVHRVLQEHRTELTAVHFNVGTFLTMETNTLTLMVGGEVPSMHLSVLGLLTALTASSRSQCFTVRTLVKILNRSCFAAPLP